MVSLESVSLCLFITKPRLYINLKSVIHSSWGLPLDLVSNLISKVFHLYLVQYMHELELVSEACVGTLSRQAGGCFSTIKYFF